MKCFMARGYLGDPEPYLYEVEKTAAELNEREYWTWIDPDGRKGLTVIRSARHCPKVRICIEWKMYAIECELKPATFQRLRCPPRTLVE